MKKIIDSIKYIKIKDLFSIIIFLFIFPLSLCVKFYNFIFKKRIWLISDSSNTARDNGYCFFKYMCNKNSNINCYYVIDYKCNDYKKVKTIGNTIKYGGFKHWLYYLSCEYNISSQKASSPAPALFYILHVYLNLFNNRVFLQHGITINDGKWLYYKNTKFKYFICGTKREYDYICKKFGYPCGHVVLTGFARWDYLYNSNVSNKKILVMPTWRSWLGRDFNNLYKTEDFKNTKFYRHWFEFLNDNNLNILLKKYDYTLYFYPHIDMIKFLNYFTYTSKNIKILDTSYDIQKAFMECDLLITDYSSVSMEYGYLRKPVLYYQFDLEEYRSKQYQKGYYSYVDDGYGPVLYDNDSLINEIEKVIKKKFNSKYYLRANTFFNYSDKNNCDRIYEILNGGRNDKNT